MSYGNVQVTVTLPASRDVGEMLVHGGKIVEALNRNRELKRRDAFRWHEHKCDKFTKSSFKLTLNFVAKIGPKAWNCVLERPKIPTFPGEHAPGPPPPPP